MSRRDIEQRLTGMIGLSLWGLRKGFGTFLTFEAGNLDQARSKDGVDHGEWHIWVRMAFWRISQSTQIVASAFMDIEEQKTSLLEGNISDQKWIIEDITIGSNLNDISIKCTDNFVIDIWVATPIADDEQWTVYMPDRKVISAYGNGRLLIGE